MKGEDMKENVLFVQDVLKRIDSDATKKEITMAMNMITPEFVKYAVDELGISGTDVRNYGGLLSVALNKFT